MALVPASLYYSKYYIFVATTMSTSPDEKNTTKVLESGKIDVRLKLAALWTSFMFISVYLDLFGFYVPGTVEDILAGIVFEFEITSLLLLSFIVLMTIPSLMVFLSVALPARVNRWTNIVVATLFIPASIFNVVGESWPHYYFGATVVVALLALVIWYAWKWPMVSEATDYTDSSARADKSV